MIPTFEKDLQGRSAEQLAAEIAAPPPVVEVELGELEAFERTCRGVYDCSWPDLAGELSLKLGRQYTTWLGRKPEWSEARRPVPSFVMLYELLPVAPPGKPDRLMIYRWKLIVKGEAERRAMVAQTSAFSRMENA